MRKWQLQEAKARLSELVQSAMNDEPQQITLRGKPAAMIIGIEEYNQLINPKGMLSFAEFMDRSPLCGSELKFDRDQSLTRESDFE